MSTSIGAWGHGKLLDTVDEEEGLCSRSCSLNSRVAGTFFRGLHEAGENGSLRTSARDCDDIRQDSLKPGHLPFGVFGKYPLHINAEMNGALSPAISGVPMLGDSLDIAMTICSAPGKAVRGTERFCGGLSLRNGVRAGATAYGTPSAPTNQVKNSKETTGSEKGLAVRMPRRLDRGRGIHQ
jgi:hypothetical protein